MKKMIKEYLSKYHMLIKYFNAIFEFSTMFACSSREKHSIIHL